MYHLTLVYLTKARDSLAQLLLSTACDSRNSEYLSAADIEAHVVDSDGTLVVVDNKVTYLKQRTGLLYDGAVDIEVYLSSYHPLCQLLLGCGSGINGSDILALTENSNAVGYVHDFV